MISALLVLGVLLVGTLGPITTITEEEYYSWKVERDRSGR